MNPEAGESRLSFVGDRIRLELRFVDGRPWPRGWVPYLRTTLGRAAVLREEMIASPHAPPNESSAAWHDLPMEVEHDRAAIEIVVTEVGYFHSKAFAVDPEGTRHWPEGRDVGTAVHPNAYRTANTIYCAFPRLFGQTKTEQPHRARQREAELERLDENGYTVIPPSGTLRDLKRELPHIIGRLGCRIIQLLPVNPTPTTYARMGRFGSPYAVLDLTSIDPALVEFDRRTTGIDQFRELVLETHRWGGRLFLDLVINHTGWGSTVQEHHPEWFVREEDGRFISPGAWGVTWHDLVELDHRKQALWDHLAEAFLIWCRRGVDGFRCDAGYKIPMPVWRYITARVREHFPDTVFLLEGLGGSAEATEALLTDGGMQWAYSELFQNLSGEQVSHYLDYSTRQSRRIGLYVHYSETHDNNRLAASGRRWALMRNGLCALSSVSGGFAFTCGVEWLATEKIDVHDRTGLAWGNPDHLIDELATLNRLLADHPAFFDTATLKRLSPHGSPVYALHRVPADQQDPVVVLVNLDPAHPQETVISREAAEPLGEDPLDLVTGCAPKCHRAARGSIAFSLEPGAIHCLAAQEAPVGPRGDAYRDARAIAAWALQTLRSRAPMENLGRFDWRALAEWIRPDPRRFLAAVSAADPGELSDDLLGALQRAADTEPYPPVIDWRLIDQHRIVPLPPNHWLLIEDTVPFRVVISTSDDTALAYRESVALGATHIAACFFPIPSPSDRASDSQTPVSSRPLSLRLERCAQDVPEVRGGLQPLPATPHLPDRFSGTSLNFHSPLEAPLALLTNGRGGMARIRVDLGRVHSKYDALLAANLHPRIPVDRHVLVKRLRAWVRANQFITPLDGESLITFQPGPPAEWRFAVPVGDGTVVGIEVRIDMLDGENTTVVELRRPSTPPPFGRALAATSPVRLTVRLDLEDRNFHAETAHTPEADHHFTRHCRSFEDRPGFVFAPSNERQLQAFADSGAYHPEGEWCHHIGHPIEASRGQIAAGDAFSPGWFDLSLEPDTPVRLVATAEPERRPDQTIGPFAADRRQANDRAAREALGESRLNDSFGRRLAIAIQAFLARRDDTKTVIAGYPWFLDWGRDTMVAARGLLAAGYHSIVKDLLKAFGRFEDRGTLPNSIHGGDLSNRNTSDAPLWYSLVAEEATAWLGDPLLQAEVDDAGKTVQTVLDHIAEGYLNGTPNGIRVDPDSGLVWSPAHFSWMDTNHPAGTPRQGYPIEIQALWIRLLRLLARVAPRNPKRDWSGLAERAEAAFHRLFWMEDEGYFGDTLAAEPGQPASEATLEKCLRSNALLPIALGIAHGARARRTVQAAIRYLVVPGAIRSLAPLPVDPPLPIHGPDGRLLNDPVHPYWGRYEGDEDTRRKPAYHNGTAWVWPLPSLAEALVRAYGFSNPAREAARAYLASLAPLLASGCLGSLPEILDGDAPHLQRGCDAQAWSVSEALRVWRLLHEGAGNGSESAKP